MGQGDDSLAPRAVPARAIDRAALFERAPEALALTRRLLGPAHPRLDEGARCALVELACPTGEAARVIRAAARVRELAAPVRGASPAARLRELLHRLSADDAELVALRVVLGLPLADVAHAGSITVAEVKDRLRAIRAAVGPDADELFDAARWELERDGRPREGDADRCAAAARDVARSLAPPPAPTRVARVRAALPLSARVAVIAVSIVLLVVLAVWLGGRTGDVVAPSAPLPTPTDLPR